MNIFLLSRNARKAAALHTDKHVVKMLLETAQILCTVLSLFSQSAPYKPTHAKHPCVLWACCRAHFEWLIELGRGLADEYARRYPGRNHKCTAVVEEIASRDLSFLPERPMDLKDVRIVDAPEGCFYGVVCGPSDKASCVSAYHEIYSRKRAGGQSMRWNKSTDPPAELAL
jgi:hypothetical protein